MVIKIDIYYWEFPETVPASRTSMNVRICSLDFGRLLLNSRENRIMEDVQKSCGSHFLLSLHESFPTPHYHNWVRFCSPLSITDIYCNKLNLVSAASLDLPEFVISGPRLICCNLICAIPSLAVEARGPWWDRPIRFALINCCRTRGQR